MKYLITGLLIFIITPMGYATDSNLIANVKTTYNNIKAIQGNFIQSICSENTGTCQQFEGKFFISRPYFSRLEVISPEKQLILTDSVNLYIYLVNKKKIYIQSANLGINFFRIFDMFLNDTTRFIVTNKDSFYTKYSYQKDTLSDSNLLEDLAVTINRKTNLIEQFSFTNNDGSELKFELSKITINPKLSNKIFKINIPKDVEIIKYQ